jgi:Ca2+-binding RTX toxin-like protein
MSLPYEPALGSLAQHIDASGPLTFDQAIDILEALQGIGGVVPAYPSALVEDVADGTASSPTAAVVQFTGVAPGVINTTADLLVFNSPNGVNVDVNGDGASVIASAGGNDVIKADGFANVIISGAGDDVVRALGGNDTIDGGDGNDKLTGGQGDDVIAGGAGNDKLYGMSGRDSLSGGDGDDIIYGGVGRDTLDGGAGDDMLYGARSGGRGNDSVSGGDGDDVIFVGRSGNDTIDGGAGDDLVVLGRKSTSVDITNDDGTITLTFSNGKTTTITDVEHIKFKDKTINFDDDGNII